MKTIRRCLYCSMLLFMSVVAFPVQQVFGQSQTYTVSLFPINSADFPAVEVNTSVVDVQGMPLMGLTGANFQVTEDGALVENPEITAFTNTSQPLAIALVLDTSGSMKNGKPSAMQNAKQAAEEFLKTLQPQDLVTLVTFGDKAQVVEPITADKVKVQAAVGQIQPGGSYTALFDGVMEACSQLMNRAERKMVIVLTDGNNNKSLYSLEQVTAEASNRKIAIHTIGFGFVNKDELTKLARLTGGTVQISPDSTSLQTSLAKIISTFREQYKIKFHSKLSADNKEHELVVRLNYDGAMDEKKTSFLATAKTISFTLPDLAEGSPVRGYQKIAPAIIGPAKLAGFEVYVDGGLLQSINTEPYEYNWNTTSLPVGQHTLLVKVKDAVGNLAEKSFPVAVEPVITVSISNPTEGQNVNGVIKITAAITSHTSIEKIEFKLDDKVVIQAMETGPYQNGEYSADWNTGSVAPGQHTIHVIATSPGNIQGEASVQCTVVVTPDGGLLWATVIVLIAALALIIPISLRNRKKIKGRATESTDRFDAIPSAGSNRRNFAATLVELDGHSPGEVHVLAGDEITLGRKRDENDIPLKGLGASRFQAIIRRLDNEYVLYNLSPDNPLLVNGQPIKQQQILAPGDEIQSGESQFRFEIG